MTVREATVRAGQPDDGDAVTGMLLSAAGWAGGGVVSAVIFQGSQRSVDPALDPFVAVVVGCLLVGPVAAAALLWQWKQVRMVSTVAALAAAGALAAVPVLAGTNALISMGQALTATVAFMALWGVVLPLAVRAAIVAVEHPWLAGDDQVGGASSQPCDSSAAVDRFAPSEARLAVASPAASLRAPTGPPVDDRLPPVHIPGR